MDPIIDKYYQWLLTFIVSEQIATIVKVASILLVIIVISIISDKITKSLIVKIITRLVYKTKSKWDDILLEKNIFNRLAHLVPAMVIKVSINLVFNDLPMLVSFTQAVIYIYITIVITIVIISLTDALNDIYNGLPFAKNRPIKGYVQLVNIFVICIAGIIIYSHISGNPIRGIIAGLGALAAVILLVFKDTILGLVASIQLTANNMVKIGDWISMPSQNTDGTVEEITLNTVKIQNWDKTISTIPTYALVSESFSNWRGMEESGGRRIKRAINIDMRSVKFCDEKMLAKFDKIDLLKEYIKDKSSELIEFNNKYHVDDSIKVNGRRMTNLGTFRAYIESYLKRHPKIHNDMTFLVRQLEPSSNGLPIEIYVFSNDQAWANYESIQSDIFDHILAIIPEFDLKVFQNPTGYDFENFKV